MGPFDIAMKTQMHPIITECVFVHVYVCVRGGGVNRQGRLLSQQSSPCVPLRELVGRDVIIITREIQQNEPSLPDW